MTKSMIPTLTSCGARTLIAKTCFVCGLLKSASEFGRIKVSGIGYHRSECHGCHSAYTGGRHNTANDESRNKAKAHREPWMLDDLKRLEEMRSAGCNAAEMAEELGRTIFGVRAMMKKIKNGEVVVDG